MDAAALFALMPIIAIVGGLTLAALGIWQRVRLREFAYRERIAMIERGLAPPPETDPTGHERIQGRYPRVDRSQVRASRFRIAGIILIGFGLGLTVLISFAAGQPRVGIGVGGSFALMGLAFFVLSILDTRHAPPARPDAAGPLPPPPGGRGTDAGGDIFSQP